MMNNNYLGFKVLHCFIWLSTLQLSLLDRYLILDTVLNFLLVNLLMARVRHVFVFNHL